MGVSRWRQLQDRPEVRLLRSDIEQINAAHDMSDALMGVVQYRSQVIGVDPVAPVNDEIAPGLIEPNRQQTL
jgi:hypothetical protein